MQSEVNVLSMIMLVEEQDCEQKDEKQPDQRLHGNDVKLR